MKKNREDKYTASGNAGGKPKAQDDILGCGRPLGDAWASLVAQKVKHLPAMWETWAQSLGQEEPLEKEMATHSSILALKIPWTEEPGKLQSMGWQRVRQD